MRLDLLAALSGLMIALQARANGELSHRLNNGLEAALVSFGSGLIIIAVIAAFNPAIKEGIRNLRAAVANKEIAKKMAEMNVDILNCIPLYPSKGTQFEDMKQPGCIAIEEIRSKAAEYLPQMRHCSRCRADAVGLLGKKMEEQDFEVLKKFEKMAIEEAVMPMKNVKEGPYVAVATLEGMLVNQHLGEAQLLQIYEFDKDHASVIEQRLTPKSGGGAKRWRELAGILHDCRTLVVNGIGENPKQILSDTGLEIIVVEGMIEEVVTGIFKGEDLKHLIKRSKTVCGLSCSGTGGGCT